MTEIQHLNPASMPPSKGWTQVVTATAGKTIYLSGQISLNGRGELVGKGDMKSQAEQTFANVKAGLAAAGADFKDVVKLTVYVVGLNAEQLPVIREVRSRYVHPEKPPASTMVGVAALASPDWLIEVEAIAVVG